MSKIIKKAPIEVQNRSGFDTSFSSSFSANCGSLVPILVDHIPPNTHINLDVACEVNLPPVVSDFYGTIEARMEFFFVPYRVAWAGWKYFFVQPPQGGANLIPSNTQQLRISNVPGVSFASTNGSSIGYKPLLDMLGLKSHAALGTSAATTIPNILPLLCYHKIYDDFYRDSRITKPVFTPILNANQIATPNWRNLPFATGVNLSTQVKQYYQFDNELLTLRQRCWDKDYFTNATTMPQAGDAASLEFEVATDGDTSTGSFTISSLRVANALQRFAETNNLVGQRMADQQFARFGCYPSDAALDRPLYLGQKRFTIYKRSVYQQTQLGDAQPTENPFSSQLGNKVSALSGYGEGFLGKFHAKDSGMLFVMFSIVPKPTYSTGNKRYMFYDKLTDFPEPLLQGTGDQPIYQRELTNNYGDDIFGYTQRFAEIKFMNDEVHGELQDGKSLSMFQLQRTFNTIQELSTSFLEIPKDYLDQISVSGNVISSYGAWCQAYFNYKKVQPFAAYSIPTLSDPKDTHTEIVDVGGKRL